MSVKKLLLVLVLVASAGVLIWAYATFWPDSIEVISQKWGRSTHSDPSSSAFTHWDEDEPPLIPAGCAKCHSTYGFQDFLGEDGTAAGTVDNPARTGSVVYCAACHNDAAHQMTEVAFPSGETVAGLGPQAVCAQCHQGLRSGAQVDEQIDGFEEDAVSEGLGFINVHYKVAAATRFGGEVRVAYQYAGQAYADRFEHTPSLDTCVECHDPHSQAIAAGACSPCHVNVVNFGDIREIRTSAADYDGDGNTQEGIAAEIESLHRRLLEAMQAYAGSVAGTPLAYADRFPYFVQDTNANGEADEEEVSGGNRYASWTPRLVRAAYNYHFVQQDRGNYSHNPHYVLQILYDSLTDLGEQVSVDTEGLVRPAGGEIEGGASQ